MRMRHKKWSMPELLGSGYYVEDRKRCGQVEGSLRAEPARLHLELGAEKGCHRRDSRFSSGDQLSRHRYQPRCSGGSETEH